MLLCVVALASFTPLFTRHQGASIGTNPHFRARCNRATAPCIMMAKDQANPGLAKPLVDGYTLVGPPPEPAVVTAVEELLTKRVEAKLSGNYPEADRLQDELRRMGISCNDRQRTWRQRTTDVKASTMPSPDTTGADDEVQKLRAAVSAKEEEATSLAAELAETRSTVATISDELKRANAAMEDLEKAAADKEDEATSLAAELAETQTTVATISDELKRTKAAVDDIEKDYALESRALAAEQQEVVRLEEQKTAIEATVLSMEGSLREAEEATEDEKRRVAALKQEMAELSAELDTTCEELRGATEQATALGKEREELSARLETTCEELESAMARTTTLQAEAAAASARIEALEADKAELATNLVASEARVASLSTELTDTEAELADSKKREEALTNVLDSANRLNEQLNKQKDALNAGFGAAKARLAEVQAEKAALSERSEAAAMRIVQLSTTLSATQNELRLTSFRLVAANERIAFVQARNEQNAARASAAGAHVIKLSSQLVTTRERLTESETSASAFQARPLLSLLAFALRRDWAAMCAAVRTELDAPATPVGRFCASLARICVRVWAKVTHMLAALVALCGRRLQSRRPPTANEREGVVDSGGRGVVVPTSNASKGWSALRWMREKRGDASSDPFSLYGA